MKKYHRIWGTLLCILLFAVMAIGCGFSDSENETKSITSGSKKDAETSQTDNHENASTDAELPETDDVENTSTDTGLSEADDTGSASTDTGLSEMNDAENTSTDTDNAKKSAPTIEEQVLFERNGITITAKKYVVDSIWGDGIKLLIENNSDKTITVSCNALIVNNYMISDLFVAEVSPGKKSNETLTLSSSGLKTAGIETVGLVEVYFHIYDSESYDTIVNTDCITIKTSAFADIKNEPEISGTELYHADGIRIIGKTVDENSILGTSILLYCENNTEKDIHISVEEVSVNGFMIDSYFYATVYSGKMAWDDITIFSSDLEENDISVIEEVELKFHIYDADSYNTIADSDYISFSVN